MSILLAILYFTRNFIQVSPLPISSTLDTLLPTCERVSERALWDIIQSCLTTIFACTWVSIHPNIPGSDKQWWQPVLRRAEIMAWTIIAPELIVCWAVRQRVGGRKLRKLYGGLGWTKTHGHFLQMGGFVLMDGNENQGVLTPEIFASLLGEGRIDFPTITEKEILDRSKGDGLSKGIAVAQTSWFVAQCLSRKAQGLVTTELELATVAFAVLNAIIYYLWWHKPQGIKCPVPIYLLAEAHDPIEIPPWVREPKEPPSDSHSPVELNRFSASEEPLDHDAKLEEQMKRRQNSLPPIPQVVDDLTAHDWQSPDNDESREALIDSTLRTEPHNNPILEFLDNRIAEPAVQFITAVMSRIDDMVNQDEVKKGSRHVPAFYAFHNLHSDFTVFMVTLQVGVLFGSIHCFGWNFPFPSRAELILWRVFSVIIAVVPWVWFALSWLTDLEAETRFILFRNVIEYLAYLSVPLYIIARIGLLVEAFTALRALPPGAFAKVQWASFLPHI